MLSQRTVGKLQRFLELMFSSRLAYGMPPALNAAEYYRRLYEADVPRELLDYVGNQHDYNPILFVHSLHEGEPIDFVNRTIERNHTVFGERNQRDWGRLFAHLRFRCSATL